jgi:hypothetical protein
MSAFSAASLALAAPVDDGRTRDRAALLVLLEGLMSSVVLVVDTEKWETPELAAEVRSILEAIDAPPAEPEVILRFQKALYRQQFYDYDARGQIILTCRCIWNRRATRAPSSKPFVSAVYTASTELPTADSN